MRLEDEIHVKQFRNPRQKLHINLMYTYNWMVARMQKVFRAYGVTIQQYNILRILRGQYPNPSTIQLLKSRMLDKQPDASRLIDRLTAKGLVTRKVSKEDRRKMDVVISDEGLTLLERMEADVMTFETYFDEITTDEVVMMNDCLDRIRDQEVAEPATGK